MNNRPVTADNTDSARSRKQATPIKNGVACFLLLARNTLTRKRIEQPRQKFHAIYQLLSRRDILCQSNHKYFQAHGLIISYIMFYICIILCKFDLF